MFKVDLHIHSGLSACGENVMSPRRIIERAAEHGLSMIALADHNATANLEPALIVARDFPGVRVICGMELTTREEVHLLALFDDLAGAKDLQTLVDANLPDLANNADFFGDQLVYDEFDEIVDVDERMRQLGCDLTLDAAVAAVHERGGFAVPAHVLRKKYSLKSQLGFIVEDAGFDAVELRWRDWLRGGCRVGDTRAGYPLVTGSDAHFIEDVGRCGMEFEPDLETVADIMAVLRQ